LAKSKAGTCQILPTAGLKAAVETHSWFAACACGTAKAPRSADFHAKGGCNLGAPSAGVKNP
jgi:hypothetical protein